VTTRQNTTGKVWAVVPLKDLSGGKQRLKPALTRDQRAGLIRAMAEDVLTALGQAKTIDHGLILSSDEMVGELAKEFGAEVLRDDGTKGLSPAVKLAADHLTEQGIATMVAVHGDLPLATAADFDDVLSGHRQAPALTIVPSHDTDGSNVMVLTPPSAIDFHYGKASFLAHLDAAAKVGIEAEICPNQNLGLDIDTPSDLQALIGYVKATNVTSKTKLFLPKSGIADGLD
jgi:2-phospho-L-lactate guanylyltransferase